MKQYKAGDKVVYKDEQIYPEVFEVTGFDEFDWMRITALVAGYDFPKNFSEKQPYEHVRLATKEEAEAGFREGSKGFNSYWYGQSEADALKEHLALQDELVEGVMAVKPSETKCGNLFCSEPSETLLCSKCRAKVKGIAMTEEQLKAFQKAYRKATMIDLTAIHGIHFAPEHNCYLSEDGNHKRVAMINGGLWMWQELQPQIEDKTKSLNSLQTRIQNHENFLKTRLKGIKDRLKRSQLEQCDFYNLSFLNGMELGLETALDFLEFALKEDKPNDDNI